MPQPAGQHPSSPSTEPTSRTAPAASSGQDIFAASAAGGSSSPLADQRAYDTALLRLVVEKGLATEEEVRRCCSLAGKRTLFGRPRSLAETLVRERAITPNQLKQVEALIANQRAGRSIPGFKMLAPLGKGTTAMVYKARQLNLDRLVAIKVMNARALRSEKAIQAFYAEGRAAAKLNHRNIVQAFDVGQCADFHYFVMEYVEGLTVHEILQDRGMIEPERALEITIAVAEALQHAHERGFVHRDVKPKNIIIDPAGIPKLADLGLARAFHDREAGLAEKGQALGTPYYISPEQIRGEVDIGPPADVYGLGATFYHMVTGLPPFTGNDAREVMEKHLSEEPRPASEVALRVPSGLAEVIDKMLRKSPADRYPDCGMLLLDLNAWKAVYTLQRGEVETGRFPVSDG